MIISESNFIRPEGMEILPLLGGQKFKIRVNDPSYKYPKSMASFGQYVLGK